VFDGGLSRRTSISAEPSRTVPAIVEMIPAALIIRTLLLKASETYTFPAESTAMAEGQSKQAPSAALRRRRSPALRAGDRIDDPVRRHLPDPVCFPLQDEEVARGVESSVNRWMFARVAGPPSPVEPPQ